MKKGCLYGLMLLLATLFASCGDDDDYYYPSVKLEFLTAYSGADGTLQSVQTDDGARYTVLADDSGTRINADSLVRVISNYGLETAADGGEGVRLYALSKAIAPLPKPADSFKDGVKTKPADVTSIWLGCGYLNMVLSVKQQAVHTLGFVEDEVTVDDRRLCHRPPHPLSRRYQRCRGLHQARLCVRAPAAVSGRRGCA